jgi:signal transduction histidine kinase/CheY-like chemotaxis protein
MQRNGSHDRAWRILIVDDETDVHDVTRLALRRRQWKQRPFYIECVDSAAKARALLEGTDTPFHVAMIDVVMETQSAGLELCEYVRATQPSSTRIILRTGQPGAAPESAILNSLDIDYYLAKAEATPDRLYAVIRACLRSSQDISTLIAFSGQLRSFTRSLMNVAKLDDLLILMQEGLSFLELKHGTSIAFFYDVALGVDRVLFGHGMSSETAAIIKEVVAGLDLTTLSLDWTKFTVETDGSELARPAFLLPFECLVDSSHEHRDARRLGVLWADALPLADQLTEFQADCQMFLENWKIAYATLELQDRLAKERMLREQMYYERLRSIATMVTGVAHELNTPLGVANTANAMLKSLVTAMIDPGTPDAERGNLADDLTEASDLLTRNLARAQKLVSSFKQLSASQVSADRFECEPMAVISDCVETMLPELRKRGVTAELSYDGDGVPPRWDGYPGHLSQVMVNLIQNTLRYGRTNDHGRIRIVLRAKESGNAGGFAIEYEDEGPGIDPAVLPRLFEPFVTTGRSQGGTGLGLAISRTIVTEVLGGTIVLASKPTRGARFSIWFPQSAPMLPESVRSESGPHSEQKA